MNTSEYRTRQEFIKRENPKGKDYIIGLDAGYSSVKVFFEKEIFCFPSYAKKLEDNMLSVAGDMDILYEDLETNEVYMLGYTAQDMIDSIDTNDTDGELFSRKRYNNKKFQILCNAAIGIAIMDKSDDREIVIQTGLPTSYVEGDTAPMKKAICKPAKFRLRIGTGNWHTIEYEIKNKNVYIMPQPAGSLYSVMMLNDGSYTHNARQYLFSNILVMDVGFGTFDFYGIKSRAIECKESIDELGMREVLKHTSKKILTELNEDIRVQALQKNLQKGTVTCVDEDKMKTEERPIGAYVEASSEEVFLEAMERSKNVTNTFRDYNYIIVTGGTGGAWIEKIKKYFSEMKSITILQGNQNDKLSYIYSNVRGYYLYRYNLNVRNS